MSSCLDKEKQMTQTLQDETKATLTSFSLPLHSPSVAAPLSQTLLATHIRSESLQKYDSSDVPFLVEQNIKIGLPTEYRCSS